jgi:predicted phage tail protein
VQKQFTEPAFNDLIRQAACLYHEHGNEDALFDFFLTRQCSVEQARQMTAIAVNDYENFIHFKKQSWRYIITGLMAALGGMYMTWYGWSHPTALGVYVIYWGLVVAGISMLIKGIADMPKKNLVGKKKDEQQPALLSDDTVI